MSERPNPRARPSDPAGTQPKVDPDSLNATPLDGHGVKLLTEGAALPATAGEAHDGSVGPVRAIPRETPHTPRFQFLLGALLALGAVAIAVAVLLLAGRGESTPTELANWSPWHPTGDQPLKAIADHVGHEYRVAGSQLVLVKPGPVQFEGVNAEVALRNPPSRGGNISVLGGNGVLYRLCGMGSDCSIDVGKPSEQRLFLLRREALELALYTFRYVDDVDNVVVLLPPPPPMRNQPRQRTGLSVLFQRDALAPELIRPVEATLELRTPSVQDAESAPDASNVERLAPLYIPSLTQGNAELKLYLVLKAYEPASSATGG